MRSKKNIILLFLVLSGILIAYINYSQEEIATEEIATEETYLEYWIFLLTIISLLSLAYNFHLFRLKNFWVKNNQLYLTPEEWGKIIKSNSYELSNNSEQLKKMTSIFSSMRNEINTKDEEIKRYKNGYDKKIYKDFLLLFIKISNRINTYIQESDNEKIHKKLNTLSVLMDNALETCGVCKIDEKIIINKDFHNTGNLVDDDPAIIKTFDMQNNYLIKEIIEDGYQLIDTEEEVIIKKAKVSIYLHEE